MKFLLLTIYFAWFLSITTFSQNTLRAKLRSTTDSLPIAYAHIGNPDLGIGTVSNIKGDFKYHFEKTIDSIYISHLGYNKFILATKDISDADTVLYLTPIHYDIAEIKITPKDSLLHWISKAIEKIPDNYPRKIHYMSAFYRECQYGKSDKIYTRLLEAAIDVQDRGIKSNLRTILCKVNELRKSEDLSERTRLDWILKKIFSSSSNKLYKSLRSDPIRNYFPFKRENLYNCLMRIQNDIKIELNLLKSCESNGKRIVEISYFSKGFVTIYGNLTINLSDFAILKLSSNSFIAKINSKDQPSQSLLTEYKKMGRYYYPIIIRNTEIADHRKVKNGHAGLGFSENTLIFNNHYLKRSSFEKIKRKFMVDKNSDMYKKQYEYHPSFWDNYNMLLLEPLDKKVETDLNQHKQLLDQFIENGK